MNLTVLLLVAAGGAIGSVGRVLVGSAIPSGRLPWATILINVSGSFLIGWLFSRLGPLTETSVRSHAFWMVGICGGFTTFSAFSLQSIEQLQKGDWFAAAGNVLLSVGLCLFATWLGIRLGRA